MAGPGSDEAGPGNDEAGPGNDEAGRESAEGGRGSDEDESSGEGEATPELVADLLAGDHRALARTITKIENRAPGYRDLVSALYRHAGEAEILGITGSPGAGKSTLVDRLAKTYRDRGETVGVIAVDPSSPFTGGAVLGDRIRMSSSVGDMDVFFRSMSTRGHLGGLSTATADAVTALDAFGKDRILVETVGAGQSEVEIIEAADTVAVLVPPSSGDDVQMLKAGILEIGDVFVVNKADLAGADRTVQELRQMLELREGAGGRGSRRAPAGHHGVDAIGADDEQADEGGQPADDGGESADDPETWEPRIVETVANRGEGIDDLVATLDDHRAYLESSGELAARERNRITDEIRTLLRDDVGALVEAELDRRGGLDAMVDAVREGETDPYRIAEAVVAPVEACLDREDG